MAIKMKKLSRLVCAVVLIFSSTQLFATDDEPEEGMVQQFVNLLFLPQDLWTSRLENISNNWERGFTPMAIEMLSLSRGELGFHFRELLQKNTGQNFGYDTNEWFVWWWQQEPAQAEIYPEFKSQLYGLIDKKFSEYFSADRINNIRLDEVRWGGVRQDGIPPLRQPEMIAAADASYLSDDNVVFGIEINGDARAYPKRILAWHEMFIDEIGGTEFAGVYCTLCGAVILYKTHFEGVRHQLGTSGFLYRSNKLMYDKDTQSLWNTTWGEPVVGPLSDKNIRLERSYLVTTTWGEWRRRHPQTTVLSLETGYQRDYGEGVAYNQYFSTDELMFSISTSDDRLKNKDEILALTFPKSGDKTMAIAADYLAKNPVYENTLGEQTFVVLTDISGANRVFDNRDVKIVEYDGDRNAVDSTGGAWELSEDGLRSGERLLARLPAHRAFWFGWHAAFPDTELVK